jgi:CDGSH-type Zn-finger protein
MRQCTCGRSQTYPYCDNTHKIKAKEMQDKKELDKEQDESSS